MEEIKRGGPGLALFHPLLHNISILMRAFPTAKPSGVAQRMEAINALHGQSNKPLISTRTLSQRVCVCVCV